MTLVPGFLHLNRWKYFQPSEQRKAKRVNYIFIFNNCRYVGYLN